MQNASLSPQLTEQPPQLPRGEEGGTLQELLCAAPSTPSLPAAVCGGPVSVRDGDTWLVGVEAQAPSNVARTILAARDAAADVLTGSYRSAAT